VTSPGDTDPYHGLLDPSYHVVADCPVGRQIPPELMVPGKGAGTLCPACRDRIEARARRPAGPADPFVPTER
jgi:hypothetical protein